MADHLVVFVTCPTKRIAHRLTRALLERRLVACVNILPSVESLFWWEGRIDKASEFLLLIKTRRSCFEALRQTVCRLHPYETPEVIALPIILAHRPYVEWIQQSLAMPASGARLPLRRRHQGRKFSENRS